MHILAWLQCKVPKAHQWSERQAESQIRDATAYENHIRDLTKCEIDYIQPGQNSTLRSAQSHVDLAQRYAVTIEESWAVKLMVRFFLVLGLKPNRPVRETRRTKITIGNHFLIR